MVNPPSYFLAIPTLEKTTSQAPSHWCLPRSSRVRRSKCTNSLNIFSKRRLWLPKIMISVFDAEMIYRTDADFYFLCWSINELQNCSLELMQKALIIDVPLFWKNNYTNLLHWESKCCVLCIAGFHEGVCESSISLLQFVQTIDQT